MEPSGAWLDIRGLEEDRTWAGLEPMREWVMRLEKKKLGYEEHVK